MNDSEANFNETQFGSIDFDYSACDRGNPLAAELERPEISAWDFLLTEPRATAFLQKMRRVILEIMETPNSKMSAACFLIATGDEAMEGASMTTTSKRYGVSPATISQACIKWCDFLGKSPSPYMRRESSGESYRQSNCNPKKTNGKNRPYRKKYNLS